MSKRGYSCRQLCKMWSFLGVVLLFVMCLCDDDVERETDHDARLRFYHGSLERYTELPIREVEKIFDTTWYDNNRDTVVYTHGYLGRPEGNAVVSVIAAYLEQNRSNVALLNWEHMAANVRPSIANSYTNWAAPNARKLGVRFADVLQTLEGHGLQLQRTHLVGHSLGAQLFGIAGNTLVAKGVLMPWITGLDPASRDFENRAPAVKLHSGSALFVDIVHSDPSRLGYRKSMGTVDFWPNFKPGQVKQPGCQAPTTTFSLDDICSHNRCWELLVDSLKYPNSIIGSHAKNYRTWKNYSEMDRHAVTLALGYRKLNALSGNYFFTTNSKSPFGLGEKGL